MVAAVVSAVVGAVVGAALSPVNSVMAQIFKLVEKDHEKSKGFKNNMVFIQNNLPIILAACMEDQLSGTSNPSAVRRVLMEDMQELTYDIQDCVDRILCYSERTGANSAYKKFGDEVQSLKERLKTAREQQSSGSGSGSNSQPSTPMGVGSYTKVKRPVGIDEPKKELCEVLEGHPEDLSVIAIVGFRGLGKTTLARAVYGCYDDPDAHADESRRFQCRAWVVASEHQDYGNLLKALQDGLHMNDPQSSDVQANIEFFLQNKRYLIVLDDIEEKQWDRLKSMFPKTGKGRIIVTTTSQEFGRLCCKHGANGYVHDMKPLGKGNSKQLLMDTLNGNLPVGFDHNSNLIVEKFDGHPLSLLSVAKYLLKKDEFPENFWNDLGDCMSKEHAFSELQQVLIKDFSSLQCQDVNLKIFLLYICVFPNTHPIRRSRLISRWLTEGYLEENTDKNLESLIDLNIIRPIDPSKNAKPKTWRAQGIMHEFLRHIGRSINFVTDFGNLEKAKCRHLFLEGRRPLIAAASNDSGKSMDQKEKPRAHSLTICGSAGEALGYFLKCELLRVLDLEECNELEDQHIFGIDKLWHLKYLSLGSKIKKVPSGIEKLLCLETLDMRKTMEVIELPLKVLELPQLEHLLGKFKLVNRNWENINMKNLLPSCHIKILKGFLIDGNPGIPMIMVHMMKLREVKIHCNSVGDDGSMCRTALLEAIEMFLERGLDTPGERHSLSLYLGNSAKDILTPIHDSFQETDRVLAKAARPDRMAYLNSLKLQGDLCGLTQIIAYVAGLKELCLWSTNNLNGDELLKLGNLTDLQYLKLAKINLEAFTIKYGDFKKLRRLCLVQCQGLPQIKNGALTDLLSLRILNKDLGTLTGIEIESLIKLQEVGLDSEVKQETRTYWENAAKEHPKRPRVLFFKRVDTDGTWSMVKYVVQEEVDEEAKLTAQHDRDQISSTSQHPNPGGSDGRLGYGNSSKGSGSSADDLAKMEGSNHDTGNEDDEKGKSSVITAVHDPNGKGKGTMDDAIEVNEGKELAPGKEGSSAKMVTVNDDMLKSQDAMLAMCKG